jgi:hypothetical protein
MSFKNLKGQIDHWIQSLQEYNFNSEHSQGRKHKNANALSQWSCWEECTHCHKVKVLADVMHVRTVAAVAAAGWGPAALRTELNNQDSGHRAHSEGSQDWPVPRTERHHLLQPHVQKLLTSMQIPRCEEWHTRVPLRISGRTIKNNPANSPSEQSEWHTDQTIWWTTRRSLGCQQGSA